MILGDMSVVASSEHLQSSSDAPLYTHDVATALACSPPRESSIPDEDVRKPIHLDGDDLERMDKRPPLPTLKQERLSSLRTVTTTVIDKLPLWMFRQMQVMRLL